MQHVELVDAQEKGGEGQAGIAEGIGRDENRRVAAVLTTTAVLFIEWPDEAQHRQRTGVAQPEQEVQRHIRTGMDASFPTANCKSLILVGDIIQDGKMAWKKSGQHLEVFDASTFQLRKTYHIS